MKQLSSLKKQRTLSLLVYFGLALMTVLFIFSTYREAQLDATTTDSQLKILILSATVAIPEIGIWLIAFRGALRFRTYTDYIKSDADDRGLRLVAIALLLLAVYTVAITAVYPIEYLFEHTVFLRAGVILGNHLPILIVLAASYLFLRGSRQLSKMVPFNMTGHQKIFLIGATVLFSVFYAIHFYITAPQLNKNSQMPHFILPAGALLVTYVLPYLVSWVMGLYACLLLANYSLHTKGSIYKARLRYLAQGIVLVFVCIFLAQLLIVSNVTLDTVNWGMVLIYGLILLAAAGFLLIYKGSKNLQLLEEI